MLEFPEIPNTEKRDLDKLERFLSGAVSSELRSANDPCTLPRLVRYYNDIYRITGMTQKDIKVLQNSIKLQYGQAIAKKHQVSGDTVKPPQIISDEHTLLLFIILRYAIRNRIRNLPQTVLYFLSLKFYSSIFHKFFRVYCEDEIWEQAMERLSEKHLFKVKGGISGYIIYVSDTVLNIYSRNISDDDVKTVDFFNFIYGLRTRLMQSFKSFAEMYYKISEEQKTKTKEKDKIDIRILSQETARSITTYGQIDEESLIYASKNSSLNYNIAKRTVEYFTDPNFFDDIRFIITLFDRLYKIEAVCSKNKRTKLINSIMRNGKVGNYNVKNEIKNFLFKLENEQELRTIREDKLILFFVYYLIMFVAKRYC